MANGFMVINSRFRPFSYDEMLKPLAAYTDEYNAQEAAYGELANNASQWERLKDSEIDQDSYNRYKEYSAALQQAADTLASEGLKPGSRRNLQAARKQYVEQIAPIEQAYKKREELSKLQREMMAKDPTLLINRGADRIALSELIANPELTPSTYSGSYIERSAAQAASALAKQMRDNPREWKGILGGQYYETRMRYGYTADEIQDALRGEGPTELRQVVQQAVQPVLGWDNREAQEQALSYAARGLWNAIGEERYQNLQNPDYLNSLERLKLRKLQEGEAPSTPALPPILSGPIRESEVVGGNKDAINYMTRGELPEDIARAQDDIEVAKAEMQKLKEQNPELSKYVNERNIHSIGKGIGYATIGGAINRNTSSPTSRKIDKTGYSEYRAAEKKLTDAEERLKNWRITQDRVKQDLAREYASLSNNPEEAAAYGSMIEGAFSAYTDSMIPVNLDRDVRSNILSIKGEGNFVEIKPNGKEKKVSPTDYKEILESGRLMLSSQGNVVTLGDRVFKMKDAGYEFNNIGTAAQNVSSFLRSWRQTPFKNPSNLTQKDFTPITDNLYGANVRIDGEPAKAIYINTPRGPQPVRIIPVSQISQGRNVEGELLQWLASENIIPVTEQWDNAPTASSTNKGMSNVGYTGPAAYDRYYGFGE